jgi:hypothetical protein
LTVTSAREKVTRRMSSSFESTVCCMLSVVCCIHHLSLSNYSYIRVRILMRSSTSKRL